MVSRFNFQKVARPKGMNHSIIPILILHNPRALIPQRQQINAILGEYHEIVRSEQEAFGRGLPQLIRLMPVLDQLRL